ncbi:ATP-binding protein [Lactococcus lactis]|uniref:ATP-binding protein n=1 Tax=Lactococcus lactis TaxID=1358 RepID=UPI0021A344B4|nr:ATP-binding protein [Lactococcus lactis]
MTIENGTVQFQVAFGAVKHFGRNLYTSNPPAIAELIANSWDAYATKCEVFYDSAEHSMILCDNGIGMTDDEFINRYAISGTSKNYNIRIPESMESRPYMGRKGIGKFSVFSLGEKYQIYTKSENEEKWKQAELIYGDLMVNSAIVDIKINYLDDLKDLELKYPNCDLSQTHGTIIVIPEMKRKFNSRTLNSLKSSLSRRFSVNLSGKYDFSLCLNGEQVDLTSHFYDTAVEFIYYFGYSLEEMKNRFSEIHDDDFFREYSDKYLEENDVKGWVGSVGKTSDLTIENELNSVGVIVYINGKLATDNILQVSQNSTIANLYLVGEVEADYLQDENEDPVLSSREGLNRELENVKLLNDALDKVRKSLVSRWSDLRSKREDGEQSYLTDIFSNEKYSSMYEELKTDEKIRFKKYIQRIFDRPENSEVGLKSFYVPFVFSVINSESIQEITVKDDDDTAEILNKFVQLFEKSEINTALRIKENFQDRLNVIEELEKNIEDKARENIFEENLSKNPWLLNVFWDLRNNKILTQETYNTMINGEMVAGRTDIIIEAGDEPYPIIIEIKRETNTSYSTPSVDSINDQIRKYRKMIKDKLYLQDPMKYKDVNLYDIKSYMILGSAAVNKLNKDDIDVLSINKIEILTYEQMITSAKNIYSRELMVDIVD